MPFEINFNNHFNIKMDRMGIVHIIKTHNPMEGLLGGNIYDINIIAGENGVGKTTLMKLIANLLTEKNYQEFDGDFNYFALFQIGRNTLKVKTSGTNPFAYNYQHPIEVESEESWLDPGRPIIYYSPFLDFNLMSIYNSSGNYPLIDLSSTQVVVSDLEEHYSEEEEDDLDTMEVESHPLLRHKLKNARRQLAFINTYGKVFKLPFNLPSTLEVKFHRLSVEGDDVSDDGNSIMEDFRSRIAEHLREYPENKLSKKDMALLLFLRNLLTFYFAAFNNDKSQSVLYHRYDAALKADIESFDNQSPKRLIFLIERFFETDEVFKSGIFLNLIALLRKKVNTNNVHFSDANNLLTLTVKTNDDFIASVFNILNTPVKKQGQERYILSAMSKFISFDWNNFSSGEKMFIDLFSKLAEARSRLSKTGQPILLLIDEGEMGFHPLWQIKYLSTLRDFINEVFFDHKLQLLLATHSPLVLSDFPKERVHLFKKTVRGRRYKVKSIGTFGQNISELLANEFFIESTLIGNLAKEYINNILEDINRYQKQIPAGRVKNLRSRIEKIDDPLIYRLLLSQLENKQNA